MQFLTICKARTDFRFAFKVVKLEFTCFSFPHIFRGTSSFDENSIYTLGALHLKIFQWWIELCSFSIKPSPRPNVDALQRKNYQQDQNITTYERKKLPRLLPPFPFGIYTRDPIRPFPTGSIFTVMPAFIIPFVPFGIWELRIPIGWSINYLVGKILFLAPKSIFS